MADNIISRLVIGQPQNPGLTMCQRCTPAGTATFTTTVPWNRSGFDHYWPFSLPPLQCPNTNCSSSAPRTMETRPKRARYEQIPHDPISTLSTPSHRIVSVHALFYTFNPVQTQIVLIRSPTRSSFSMPMATISPPSTRTGLLDEILKTVRIALNRSLIPEVVIDQVVDRQRHIPDIFRYDNLAIIIHPINQKQIDLMKSVESLQTCQINVLDVVLPNRSSSTPKLAVTTQAVLGCMELGSYLQFRLAPLTIRHSYVSAIELHPSELLEYEYGAILPSMSRHQRQYVLLEIQSGDTLDLIGEWRLDYGRHPKFGRYSRPDISFYTCRGDPQQYIWLPDCSMIVREACLLSSASPKLNTCRMAHIPILWVDVDTIIAAASRQSPSREKLFHDVTTIKRRVRSMAITHRIVELFRRDRDDIHEKLLCRQQLNAGQVPLKHDIDRYHQVMGLAIASLAGVAIRIPWAIVSYLISSTTSSSSDFSDQ